MDRQPQPPCSSGSIVSRTLTARFILSRSEERQRAKTSSVFQHFAALQRGLFFMVAAIVLIEPMAIATRHAEVELRLIRCRPPILFAPTPRTTLATRTQAPKAAKRLASINPGSLR